MMVEEGGLVDFMEPEVELKVEEPGGDLCDVDGVKIEPADFDEERHSWHQPGSSSILGP